MKNTHEVITATLLLLFIFSAFSVFGQKKKYLNPLPRMGIDVAKGPDTWAYYIVFGSNWFK